MQRFREMGIQPATRHGQNFLIDLNLQRVIVEAAELDRRDVVLEVGTGTGGLTTQIAAAAGAVITVEIDGHLFELASELLLDYDNVTMLKQDALKNKNHFAPEVLAAIDEHLSAEPDRRLKLVANLPYNVATPVLSNLLACEPPPHTMVATIQKEVAERIVASPWSKDYGALSAWVQCQADAEIVRTMPPAVFWPPPKVQSAIVKIVIDRQRRSAIPDLKFFHQFTKAIFIHRRKFLRANMTAALKRHASKEEVDAIMARLELTGDVRTEQLDVATLLRLAEAVRELAPDWTL